MTLPNSLSPYPQFVPTVLIGGLLVGFLDAADALVAFGLLGHNPVQVYQFVASGALGPSAFRGGYGAALLGLAFHFLISFGAAAVFYFAARWFSILWRQAVPCGLVYGALVYFFMNEIVLPLSLVPPSPFFLPLFLNGIIGHAVFVGLPPALLARRSAAGSPSSLRVSKI